MRAQIVEEIRRLTKAAGGQPPGTKAFERDTGIAPHHWRGKYWARWGDALAEAGFAPNEWQQRLDSDSILKGIIAACRYFGRFPTKAELSVYRQSDPTVPTDQAVRRHFGRQADLITALGQLIQGDESHSDIAGMLPIPRTNQTTAEPSPKVSEGFVYLFKSGEHFKIGRSSDLERRVKQIQPALPDQLTIEHSIRTDDPPGIEAYWHRRFADKRANGEWFKLTRADVAAFKKRKYQ